MANFQTLFCNFPFVQRYSKQTDLLNKLTYLPLNTCSICHSRLIHSPIWLSLLQCLDISFSPKNKSSISLIDFIPISKYPDWILKYLLLHFCNFLLAIIFCTFRVYPPELILKFRGLFFRYNNLLCDLDVLQKISYKYFLLCLLCLICADFSFMKIKIMLFERI